MRSTEADVNWTIPEKLNGLDPVYLISVYKKKNISLPLVSSNLVEETNSSLELKHNLLILTKQSSNNELDAKIENLLPYTQYFITVKTCNHDLRQPGVIYCLNGTSKVSSNVTFEKNFYKLVTSQDRPELQLPPILISLNSSFAVVGVVSPARPNGIILLYEIWIKSSSSQTDALSSLNNQNLVCAIEDLYDPNNANSILNSNKSKICVIKNLKPNSVYYISASSSNLIGRSPFSTELTIRTFENPPLCPPLLIAARSNESDNIFFR